MILLAACAPSLLGPDPTSPFQVVRADAPGVIAHDFSSLDACVIDGELVVAGLRRDPPTWWEERFPSLFFDALVTRDAASWAVRRFHVDAPGVSLLDPSLAVGPEGLVLHYVRADGMGDPAEGSRPTEIVRARRTGPTTFGDAEVVHRGRGIVDPSAAWFQGAWHLYATHDHHEIVRVADGKESVVAQGTVPHVRAGADGLRMTAQRPGEIVRLASADGLSWRESGTVPKSCASPVTAELGATTLMLCVEERDRRGGGP